MRETLQRGKNAFHDSLEGRELHLGCAARRGRGRLPVEEHESGSRRSAQFAGRMIGQPAVAPPGGDVVVKYRKVSGQRR